MRHRLAARHAPHDDVEERADGQADQGHQGEQDEHGVTLGGEAVRCRARAPGCGQVCGHGQSVTFATRYGELTGLRKYGGGA